MSTISVYYFSICTLLRSTLLLFVCSTLLLFMCTSLVLLVCSTLVLFVCSTLVLFVFVCSSLVLFVCTTSSHLGVAEKGRVKERGHIQTFSFKQFFGIL